MRNGNIIKQYLAAVNGCIWSVPLNGYCVQDGLKSKIAMLEIKMQFYMIYDKRKLAEQRGYMKAYL